MGNLQKEFVPYELALRLKELGFDYNILGFYYDNKLLEHCCGNTEVKDLEKGDVPAPTFSQAFRWFREKYELMGHVEKGYHPTNYYPIIHQKESHKYNPSLWFDTYEEAELACLEKLIEIVEKQEKK